MQTISEYEKAMFKIKAVLKYSDKEFLENLDERIAIRPTTTPRNYADSHIAEIQQAVATNRLISMTYYSQYNDKTTSRDVEPLGMVFYSGKWHLIAFCRLRRDLRDFRTDRIQKVRLENEVIDPSAHPNYLDFLNEAILGTDAKEAIVRVSPMSARFMGEQKYYMGYVEEKKLDDGSYEMKFVTPHYEYLSRWLMMYGDQVEIISPSELQGIAANFAKELLEHHSAPFLTNV